MRDRGAAAHNVRSICLSDPAHFTLGGTAAAWPLAARADLTTSLRRPACAVSAWPCGRPPANCGLRRRWQPASGHPYGNRAQKVALADVDAAMAQDRVGDCEVEIEVRQHEMIEVIVPLHVTLVARAERERDLTIGRGIDLL